MLHSVIVIYYVTAKNIGYFFYLFLIYFHECFFKFFSIYYLISDYNPIRNKRARDGKNSLPATERNNTISTVFLIQ